MATDVNIPKRQYVALTALSDLTDPQFDDLERGLTETSASISVRSFATRVAQKVKSISEDDLMDYVVMLCGLYPAKESHGKSASEIASDIRATIESEAPPTFQKERLPIIESRVSRLLSIKKGIAITAKALDVATEHNNVCCTSRIVSDMRPVFSEDASEIVGGLIIHEFNISYHHNGDLQEFFVAMTADDLDDLKEIIERAEKKASLMRTSLSKSGITEIGPD